MKKIKNPWIGAEGYNCFACCPDNPHGLHMEFYEDGDEVVCRWQPSVYFQSWIDTVHGGIQATLIDETCGWVISRKFQTVGVTTKMEIRYHKPVRTSAGVLEIRARVVEQRRNLLTVEAEIRNPEGVVCTSATAGFFLTPREKLDPMYHRDYVLEDEE